MRPTILLFGDSITQQGFGWTENDVGWVSLLARDYARKADVWNRGYSGYNSRMALTVLPTTLPQQKILFATVFFGANDAALEGELQHVPVQEYGENLSTIIQHMRRDLRRPLPIILFTPPPVDADAWYEERGLPASGKRNDRANDNARIYGEKVKQIASEQRCSVLDVFDLLEGHGSEYGTYLRDGLHLSSSGNLRLYEGLMQLLEQEHPDILSRNIPLEGKPWRDLC